MKPRSLDRKRRELTDFLLHHRNKLKPADVGLPTTGRRRTPGLRREEVATLAGVGLTWYTWFEQGRDIGVSEQFLLNVAKALRLDDAECCHLFLLSQGRPPPYEAHQTQGVPPLTQALMDDLSKPAYVINLRWDIVAWNDAADQLFELSRRAPHERNAIRMLFVDLALRRRLPNWDSDAYKMLAQFRCDLAIAPDDAVMQEFIEGLIKSSPAFQQWWREPVLKEYAHGVTSLQDLHGKHRCFEHETLIVDEYRHLRMVIYFESAGGGTWEVR